MLDGRMYYVDGMVWSAGNDLQYGVERLMPVRHQSENDQDSNSPNSSRGCWDSVHDEKHQLILLTVEHGC